MEPKGVSEKKRQQAGQAPAATLVFNSQPLFCSLFVFGCFQWIRSKRTPRLMQCLSFSSLCLGVGLPYVFLSLFMCV